jgi:hypothetical protein
MARPGRPPQFEIAEGAPPQKRIKASEHALKTTIKAMKESGLTISKVCINGGRIEIHCVDGAYRDKEEEDDEYSGLGLEKW